MDFSDFWKTLILATLPVIVGGGVIVGGIEYLSKDRELDIKMVEIGLSILRSDPSKEGQISPAREWAITLVEKHSGQDFTDEDKRNLLVQPLRITETDAAKALIVSPPSIRQLTCFDKYAKLDAERISAVPEKTTSDINLSKEMGSECADYIAYWRELSSLKFPNMPSLNDIEAPERKR